MNSWISERDDGVILRFKATPRSSRRRIALVEDELKIYVNSPASDNLANKEIIKYLAKTLDLKKQNIQIITGEKNRQKSVFLANSTLNTIKEKVIEVSDG